MKNKMKKDLLIETNRRLREVAQELKAENKKLSNELKVDVAARRKVYSARTVLLMVMTGMPRSVT